MGELGWDAACQITIPYNKTLLKIVSNAFQSKFNICFLSKDYLPYLVSLMYPSAFQVTHEDSPQILNTSFSSPVAKRNTVMAYRSIRWVSDFVVCISSYNKKHAALYFGELRS